MLRYIGHGSFVAGVPARDLTDDEVKKYGEKKLLESGLYEKKREYKPRKIETPEQEAEE